MDHTIFFLLKKFKYFLRNNYFIYFIYNYFFLLLFDKEKFNLTIPKKNTFLLIDGFPRSGNSFVASLCRLMFKSNHIVSHSHNINVIKKALKLKIKCIILIRSPENCIVSLLKSNKEFKYYKNRKLNTFYLDQYFLYYNYIDKIKNHKKILLINVETLSLSKIIEKIIKFVKPKTKKNKYKNIKYRDIFEQIRHQRKKILKNSKRESYNKHSIKEKKSSIFSKEILTNSKYQNSFVIFKKLNQKFVNETK